MRIVTGGKKIKANPDIFNFFQKKSKLKFAIAYETGIRCFAFEVLVSEVLYDMTPVFRQQD
jgi:hypothetical protein